MMVSPSLFTIPMATKDGQLFVKELFASAPHLGCFVDVGFSKWLDDQFGSEPNVHLSELTQEQEFDLRRVVEQSGFKCGFADPRASWMLPALARVFPDAHFLLLAEAPGRVLTSPSDAGGPAHALKQWREVARRFLSFSQRLPTRCTLVNLEEARSNPRGFVGICERILGMPETRRLSTSLASEAESALGMLGDLILRSDQELAPLIEELAVSCQWLESQAPSSASSLLTVEPQTAPMLSWIVNMQAAAEQVRELHQLRAEALEIRTNLDASILARKAAFACHLELQESANRQIAYLQLHLLQVQEELELLHTERNARTGTAPAILAAALDGMSVDRVQLGAHRDELPHRQLDLSLLGVRESRFLVDEMQVRIVEHHGNAGLALFGTPQLVDQLSCWKESGREGGAAFMLLLPSEAGSREVFARMPAREWSFINSVARLAEQSILEHQHVMGAAGAWLLTTRRLIRELGELPPCFRYDSLEVRAHGGLAVPALCIEYGGATFEQVAAERCRVIWWLGNARPMAANTRVELLADTSSDPGSMINAWPSGVDGRAAESLVLQFDDLRSEHWRQSAWSRLGVVDMRLLAAMLATFPTAARIATAANLVQGIWREHLVAVAEKMQSAAVRMRYRPGLRGTLRHRLASRFSRIT